MVVAFAFLVVIPEGNLRLASTHMPWNPEALSIAQTRFANRIHHLASTPSTSTIALEAAQAGAPEGSLWVADEQTAGRGRGGHVWHSEPEAGLYFSFILRPTLPPDQALHLSLATGLAIQSAVAGLTGQTPDLRWPNDLLFGEKKFGGILVETALTPSATLRHAVIGIGINVAHSAFPPGLAPIATSLLLATGRAPAREDLLAAILHTLDREFTLLPSSDLLTRFTHASTWVQGKSVQVGEAEGYTGLTAGLDPRGFLLVRTRGGSLRTVLSGGVRPA